MSDQSPQGQPHFPPRPGGGSPSYGGNHYASRPGGGGGFGAGPVQPTQPPQPSQSAQPAQPAWPATATTPQPTQQSSWSSSRTEPDTADFPAVSKPSRAARSASKSSSINSAPVQFLAPSLICAVVSLAISIFVITSPIRDIDNEQLIYSVIAWLFALVGISALWLYFTKDTEAKSAGAYQSEGWKTAVYWVVIVGLGVAILMSAWLFAQWFGKF